MENKRVDNNDYTTGVFWHILLFPTTASLRIVERSSTNDHKGVLLQMRVKKTRAEAKLSR